MDRMICIVGPTAVGKTALSVRLAQETDAEIVSFDSMQVYRGMEIGTAAPTEAEMGGIRHHMIGVVDPTKPFSVGRYVEMADACVQDILRRGKPVVLVGGTGLYIDSLIAGRAFAPYPQTGRRQELEQRAEREGIMPLYEELRRVDPEAAQAIHPSNRKRVIRALEVWLETGRPISQHNRESRLIPPKYDPLRLSIDFADREEHLRRIGLRVDRMLDDGLIDEVRRLLDGGVRPDSTAMQAIGYKELVPYVRGLTDDLPAAAEEIKLRTRQYAKRQRTWFRRDEALHRLSVDRMTQDEIIHFIRQLLPEYGI